MFMVTGSCVSVGLPIASSCRELGLWGDRLQERLILNCVSNAKSFQLMVRLLSSRLDLLSCLVPPSDYNSAPEIWEFVFHKLSDWSSIMKQVPNGSRKVVERPDKTLRNSGIGKSQKWFRVRIIESGNFWKDSVSFLQPLYEDLGSGSSKIYCVYCNVALSIVCCVISQEPPSRHSVSFWK